MIKKNRGTKRFTTDDVIELVEYYLNSAIKDKSNRHIRVLLVEDTLDLTGEVSYVYITALIYNKSTEKPFVYKGGYYPDPITDLDGEAFRMYNDIRNKVLVGND